MSNILDMDENNLIFTEDGDKVLCGGYEIDNPLINNNMPAIVSVKRGGGGGTLAVPAGLFLLQQHVKTGTKPFIIDHEEVEEITDNLYDNLLSLMQIEDVPKKKKITRGKRSKGKRSTRRKR